MLTTKTPSQVPRMLARAVDQPLRRLRGLPAPRALSLANSSAGARLGLLCVVSVIAVTVLESVSPGLASLGSLLFIPVLVSAWLLDRRAAVIVSSLAVAARIAGYTIAAVDVGTAIAEVVTLGALGIITSVAAQAVADAREREARIAAQKREVQILEERERIALRLTDTAIRRLYGMSLRLQAMSSVVEQHEVKMGLDEAIDETDRLMTDFRDLIFKPER